MILEKVAIYASTAERPLSTSPFAVMASLSHIFWEGEFHCLFLTSPQIFDNF